VQGKTHLAVGALTGCVIAQSAGIKDPWAVSEIQPPSWGLPVPPGAFVLGGWLSHIALDALSSGVPALWPLPWRVTLARVRTGGGLDSALGQMAIVAQLIFLLRWLLV
jgi:membrane-bound metal-dependent hydrolase YbcI (DUF457 family)